MHRADPLASRPSPRWRGRHDSPLGAAPSAHSSSPPDPGPAPLTPRRARVTVREIPRAPLAGPQARRAISGVADEPWALVMPAGAGLVAAPPVRPVPGGPVPAG